jgi:hypothetical protein
MCIFASAFPQVIMDVGSGGSVYVCKHLYHTVRLLRALRFETGVYILTGNGENKAHGWSEQENTNNRSNSQCHAGGSREMHRYGSCLRVCLCVCMCFFVSASVFMCLCMC